VLLADDHPELLALVIRLIGSEFEIVHVCNNGLAVVEMAAALEADVLVLDIAMPALNGIDAALRLKAQGCTAKVVFLTIHADPDYLQSALAAGATGYVVKDRLATDLIPALRSAVAGHRFVSPTLAMDVEV
jgi:DNA-binding NarL/FixJ family response regulator